MLTEAYFFFKVSLSNSTLKSIQKFIIETGFDYVCAAHRFFLFL